MFKGKKIETKYYEPVFGNEPTKENPFPELRTHLFNIEENQSLND